MQPGRRAGRAVRLRHELRRLGRLHLPDDEHLRAQRPEVAVRDRRLEPAADRGDGHADQRHRPDRDRHGGAGPGQGAVPAAAWPRRTVARRFG